MAEDKTTKRNWRFKDLTGQRFGNLVAIENVPPQYASGTCRGATMWRCRCDCSNTVVASYSNLKSGATKSCGCLRKDRSIRAKGKRRQRMLSIEQAKKEREHGMVHTPEYVAWQRAKDRCFNPNSNCFTDYGGRGITMCQEWVLSFKQFYSDMGPRPEGTSLDRINNEGHYSKDNCRWATTLQQASNRRPRRWHKRPE